MQALQDYSVPAATLPTCLFAAQDTNIGDPWHGWGEVLQDPRHRRIAVPGNHQSIRAGIEPRSAGRSCKHFLKPEVNVQMRHDEIAASAPAADGPLELNAPGQNWRIRFWAVFIGQGFSLIGGALAQFLLFWWITDATGSVAALGTVSMFGILPQALLGP